MTTNADGRTECSGTGGRLADHELLGIDPRRTRLAVAALAVVLAVLAGSHAARVVTVGDVPLDTYTPRFDALSTVAILAATGAGAAAPLYAVWNGGPLLSAAIPVAPVAAGDALAGRYVLDLDAVIALTVGAASAALALYAADYRVAGSLRPWRDRPAGEWEDRLLAVSVASAVGLAAAGSFLTAAPPHARSWYLPFATLWLLPVAIGGAYWNARLRTR